MLEKRSGESEGSELTFTLRDGKCCQLKNEKRGQESLCSTLGGAQ